MSTKAIIQTRMGSTRLPGKILMKLNDVSVLECLLNQISFSTILDDVILATTNNKEDDVIESFANTNSLNYFRGDSFDVLDRFYQCAKKYSVDNIVRITSDCPLIDPTIMDDVINLYQSKNYDYVNNFYKNRCPSGFEVEIFSFACLELVWNNAQNDDREHVTKYIYNNPQIFSIGTIENKNSYPNLHLSVDTEQDLKLLQSLYGKISSKPILFSDVLNVISLDPSLLEINHSKL